ncbi:ABC transporter permease [Tsukamurella sp. 8F]|uniref:ABC transporter permease n=1 Tax=unclassified Tsukamurella TaxID=2633480 RepID=UPI0023B954F5|nr:MULTISPECIES: ABC transporter permease [unclassified Tsukamurella]MDF0528393.1 ABC transporter permease [Tsukamurella sp. 8J]MDF0586218.1 ABC transporter permease [Tsukamurella sp. 8F]
MTDGYVVPATSAPAGVRPRPPLLLVAGGVLLALVVLAGVLAPLLAPYDPISQIPAANLLPPSGSHPLGTDELDRDVLSRVLYGIRTSLTVIAVAVPVGAVAGVTLGLFGASNRFADVLLSRVTDVILAFPALILAVLVTALRGPGSVTVVIAIAIAEAPSFARLTRSEVLRLRSQPYVEASRLAGGSSAWVLTRHILPNAAEPLLVQAALALSLGVFVEAGMSFVGVGVRPPQPSLGSLLSEAVYNWDANAGYAIGPLVAIIALSLSLLAVARGVAGWRR